MWPEIIFPLQLILGYVAWFLCFRTYLLPRLKSMDQVEAHRAIATLHSFRFLRIGLYSARRRWQSSGQLRPFRRLLGLCYRPAGHLGAAYGQDTSALLAVRDCLQSCGRDRPRSRLLPRHPRRTSSAGWAVGRSLRDPDHLRAPADDHSHRCLLFAVPSSAQTECRICRRCCRFLSLDSGRFGNWRIEMKNAGSFAPGVLLFRTILRAAGYC